MSQEYTEKDMSKDIDSLIAICFKDSSSPDAELRNINCKIILLESAAKFQKHNLLSEEKNSPAIL